MCAEQVSTTFRYETGGAYDETFDRDGTVRPQYAEVIAHLADVDLDSLTSGVDVHLKEREVAFGGEDGHPFTVDPVPRILTTAEWQRLVTGVGQRVRALEAFASDVYGERRVVSEGIVPARVVDGSAYFEEDLRGVQPPAGARISIPGLDVIRDEAGDFRVLEDNVRTPSGIAFAMAAGDAVAEGLQQAVPAPDPQTRKQIAAALQRVLEASAPDVDGVLVLLTDGPRNTAWYEHRRLAELAGLELATPDELVRRGSEVQLRDGRRVRAVYRRTSEDRVRDADGGLTEVAELLLEPVRDGGVGLVNWFGNGVADDKDVYAYVDDLIRFFLNEEPAVPSVSTYELVDPDRREEVLDRLDELVVKPRDGQGGDGVVIGRTATAEEKDRARAAIRENPHDWIAQDTVLLSTHPTVVDGRLVPRHVDLRPFAFHDGTDVVVPPGPLTRVALHEGSMVVNSSKEGGAKATWVA